MLANSGTELWLFRLPRVFNLLFVAMRTPSQAVRSNSELLPSIFLLRSFTHESSNLVWISRPEHNQASPRRNYFNVGCTLYQPVNIFTDHARIFLIRICVLSLAAQPPLHLKMRRTTLIMDSYWMFCLKKWVFPKRVKTDPTSEREHPRDFLALSHALEWFHQMLWEPIRFIT